MGAVRRMIPKIALCDSSVLITGSTGTGKEHLARSVHLLSKRAGGPFVAINCSAIPDTLFESEFFGFERGSFTGAFAAQKGKALLADGGTLFLDEIAELSIFAQAKLLRMLEEREVTPIGGERPRKLDIRVVAATNRKIEEAVAAGQLRSDLYYRLNVARIALPDLADRPEDIPLFFDHFIAKFNRRRGAQVRRPNPELMNLLSRYRWPGNVREIRNFVEAVFIDPPRGAIGFADIPAAFAALRDQFARTEGDERARIVAALERTNWNKAEAAKSLSWSRMTLYRKLTKHQVVRGGLSQADDPDREP
jgi:two-component system response regulator HydG